MSDVVAGPPVGEVVAGKYRIEAHLGSGAMGAVYRVRHEVTGGTFALKWMPAQQSDSPERRARFLREARLQAQVQHPGVVDVYDVAELGDAMYIVMDLVEGESLGARMRRARLSVSEAVELCLEVLEPVRAAHEAGVIHRDLKPDNVMLCEGRGPRVRVLDFGLCKLAEPDEPTALTMTGAIMGTPYYMSPEQLRGDRDIDQRTDIYAVGVMLYQMLTGQVPFQGDNFADLVLRIVGTEPLPPSRLVPELDLALEAVVLRAMARERDRRYPNAAAFAAELRNPPPVARDSTTVMQPFRVTPPPAEASGKATQMDGFDPPSVRSVQSRSRPSDRPASVRQRFDSEPVPAPPRRGLALPIVVGALVFCAVLGAWALFSSGGSEPPSKVAVPNDEAQAPQDNKGQATGNAAAAPVVAKDELPRGVTPPPAPAEGGGWLDIQAPAAEQPPAPEPVAAPPPPTTSTSSTTPRPPRKGKRPKRRIREIKERGIIDPFADE